MKFTTQPKTVITKVKATSNDSFQIEIIDELVRENQSPLGLLNKGDERFNSKPQQVRAYVKVTPESMKEHFGIEEQNLIDLAIGEDLELDIEQPQMAGMLMRVQVEETIIPSDWQRANLMTGMKRLKVNENTLKSKTMKKSDKLVLDEFGYFVDDLGNPIFRNTTVVFGEPKHIFIQGTLIAAEEVTSSVVLAVMDEEEVKSLV